jgi:transcriptional regulator with XRE-family HTH domain
MSISEEEFRQLLGNRIEELRTSKKYGVREFSLIADIEHHQLINVEKGRIDVRLRTLRKIAIGLNVEVMELFNFTTLTQPIR